MHAGVMMARANFGKRPKTEVLYVPSQSKHIYICVLFVYILATNSDGLQPSSFLLLGRNMYVYLYKYAHIKVFQRRSRVRYSATRCLPMSFCSPLDTPNGKCFESLVPSTAQADSLSKTVAVVLRNTSNCRLTANLDATQRF